MVDGCLSPVYKLSEHIGALCAERDTNATISGLARELDSNVSYLTKFAAHIGKTK
jgi:hypothetical protein